MDYYKNLKKQVIVKPISHGDFSSGKFAIFANDLSTLPNIPDFQQSYLSPLIIQKKIEKISDIRTTVFVNRAFSFEIKHKDNLKILDLRVFNPDELEYKLIDTPKLIQEKILNLMNLLDISFGAFDFAYTKLRKWIFLEVNPNGQWAWLEQMTGVCMTDSLIGLLLSG